MLSSVIITFGKMFSKTLRLLNLGDGSTWPGHIALSAKPDFIKDIFNSNPDIKIIIIAGTNGKTTTASLIKYVLEKSDKKVFQNKSGANLLNGIASSLIINSNIKGKLNYDFAIFEIDENALPHLLNQATPAYLILLNLFRDQLDRYGEINTIASRWSIAVRKLTNQTTLILNADDPQITHIAINSNAKTKYFGCSDVSIRHNKTDHAADSNYCPKCRDKLSYHDRTFSHLGNWYCSRCGLTRPKLDLNNFPVYPLPGTYNKYNTHAAVLTLLKIGLSKIDIKNSFEGFKPAFGRQEIVNYRNKEVQIFLSKNPTSFNQSFRTITELGAKDLLIILNDRIPDGQDISWIWDTDINSIEKFNRVLVSGDRVYDMALRLKYELGIRNFQLKVKTYENLNIAIKEGVRLSASNETMYILPTYSAMLEVRKILTGKKIL